MPSDRVLGLIATFGFVVTITCWALTFFGYVPSEVIPTTPLYVGVILVGIPSALRSEANRKDRTKLRFTVPTGVIVAVIIGATIIFGIGLADLAANPTPPAVDRLWFTVLSAIYGGAAGLLLLLEKCE